MRLSFLGKSYTASTNAFEANMTGETATFLGKPYARKQFNVAQRQKPADLTYRGIPCTRQAVEQPEKTTQDKPVSVKWMPVSDSLTFRTFSGLVTSGRNQNLPQEIQINLPQIDSFGSAMLFVQPEKNRGISVSNGFKARAIKIDKANKTALIQITRVDGGTDWDRDLKLNLLLVN